MKKLSSKTTIILLCFFGLQGYSLASIKCWKNDKGIRECSFSVPPKYLGREIQIINNQGQVIKTIPADRTPEQKKQDAIKAKIAAEEKRLLDEQRRKDRILVNTFVSVEDIILSRDSKAIAIDSIIKITQSNRAKQQKILDRDTKRAGNYERKSLKVPKNILESIEASRAKIKEYDDFIESRKQEKVELYKKYDADIARFKELKAIKPR